eukprot:13206988-Alexandrium_andersonii.AAC.1
MYKPRPSLPRARTPAAGARRGKQASDLGIQHMDGVDAEQVVLGSQGQHAGAVARHTATPSLHAAASKVLQLGRGLPEVAAEVAEDVLHGE